MKRTSLRTASFALLGLAAALSRAAVTYTFTDDAENAFSFTTSTFITSTTSFGLGDINNTGNTGVLGGTFQPNTGVDALNFDGFAPFFLGFIPFSGSYGFEQGAFGAVGTYISTSGSVTNPFATFYTVGTLVVSGSPDVSSVPGPAALASFALGGLARLRRRKA